MSHARTLACATALVLAVTATSASAQQSVELSIAGGWLSPTGGDFADTHSGFGTDLAVRVPTGERYTLGGGVHWSRHGVDFAEDSYDVLAVFAEPRVLLGSGEGSARPFVAGRIAWVREAITVGTQDRSANGLGLGLLVGAVVSVSDALDVEAGVGGYHLAFGDFRSGGSGLGIDGGSGRAIALRLALNLRP
jgi:hypothetical protein